MKDVQEIVDANGCHFQNIVSLTLRVLSAHSADVSDVRSV